MRDRLDAIAAWVDDHERELLWGVVLVAVVVRLLYAAVAVSAKLTDDETHFWAIAGSVADGDGYEYAGEPTAWRPPVYTYAVALLRWIGLGVRGVQVVQALVAASIPLLLVACTRRLDLPKWAGVMAAAIGAVYPPFVHLSSQVLSENASIPLLLLAVWLSLVVFAAPRAWPLAAGAGIAWGAAILARPAAIPAFAVALVVALVRRPTSALMALAVGALVVAPWIVRNDDRVGGPTPVVSNESFTLWVSNRLDTDELKDVFRDPAYPGLQDYGVYGRDFPGIHDLARREGFDFDGADEATRDRWFRELVVDDVGEDPWRFARRAAAKSVLALAPAPDNASQQERTSAGAKVVLWLTSGPVILLGVAGLALLAGRGGANGIFLALAAAISLVGLATHLPYVRYRVGAVDPFFILGAVAITASQISSNARSHTRSATATAAASPSPNR